MIANFESMLTQMQAVSQASMDKLATQVKYNKRVKKLTPWE